MKLADGRVLGPIDLDRIRRLVARDRITGVEAAKAHPDGEWKDINQFVPIAELIVARAMGKLDETRVTQAHSSYRPLLGAPATASALPGATQVLSHSLKLQTATVDLARDPNRTTILPASPPTSGPPSEFPSEDDERTVVGEHLVELDRDVSDDGDRTQVGTFEDQVVAASGMSNSSLDAPAGLRLTGNRGAASGLPVAFAGAPRPGTDLAREVAEAHTIAFQRPVELDQLPPGAHAGGSPSARRAGQGNTTWDTIKAVLASVALGMLLNQLITPESDKTAPRRLPPMRAQLPDYRPGKADPRKSSEVYNDAMKYYLADTAVGYRLSAQRFRLAASYDIDNVKALAMLASSYINLIDSSNKDENYFAVILKLIEMTRQKAMDLPETIIADVEFFLTVNKAEAAYNRVVEYSKTHPNYGLEMVYYLALSFYQRGDLASAANYLGRFPDEKAFSPKIFYLRGQIAERAGDPQAALNAYGQALKLNPNHARSRLRISEIAGRAGEYRKVASHLEFLVQNPNLMAPKEQARAYFLAAQLSVIERRPDIALSYIERAVSLDKDNHDYLIELYTMRADAGEKSEKNKRAARMYFVLKDGEALLKQNRVPEALSKFLEARQVNPKSPVPPLRIGDMFKIQNDLVNARVNYKIAAELDKDSIETWSKYIDVLIQSYEWEEAQKAMDKFRKLPVPQSGIDKAAGDMYERQNQHVQAQAFYRRAMARDHIDPDVYLSYAKSLMGTQNYKEAPFFFALALRLDPLNVNATIGIAKCIAATDSIDRAIVQLQDELQKSPSARAELLGAIAEFQMQKGDWEQAQATISDAMTASPDYAYAWKLQAQVYMSREGVEKGILDRALAAYQSYSERNSSDPSGYLERYRIFIKKTEFEKASDELKKIHLIYPRYPNLHYYQGALYSIMGNRRAAIEEFQGELKNNPNGTPAMLAIGKEFIEAGQYADALAQFNKAMQLQPQASDPKHLSGYANYLMKNYQAAIALYNAALSLDRGNPLIYKRLGMAHREMGDNAGASANFRKYLEMEPDAPDKAEFQRLL